MITHLPVLQVLIPLMAAPLCILVNRERAVWLIAFLAMLGSLACSIQLLESVSKAGPISYHMGGWAPPLGIEYRIDLFSAWMLVIISGAGALVLSYARSSISLEVPAQKRSYFYVAWLLCSGALMGIVSSGDIFNIFVFLEISALASYVLIALSSDRRALLASFNYLILGTVGATFLLIGIGLLYAMTGTLNLADLSDRVAAAGSSATIFTAFCFIVVGILLKLAVFPLHGWLTNAYAYAPSAVSALLAATATKTAFYLLARFCYTLFGVEFSFSTLPMGEILLTLGLLGVFAGSLQAIVQQDLKRMFACSSISQIGYMVLALGLVSSAGLTAAFIHLFNHALMKAAVFMALGAVLYSTGGVSLSHIAGQGQRIPLTMMVILIAGFSLVGIPGTAGFVSKWYLVVALMEQGLVLLTLLVLVGSLLTAMYVWKIIESAFLRPSSGATIREAPLAMLLPAILAAGANIYFGFDTSLTVPVSTSAATFLSGINP